jgi:DNA-binding response OmpR family regulator
MKHMKILVADDEPGIRSLIQDALSMQGHDVTCAENGVEALSMMVSECFDVLFLDIRMPKGDGLTTLKEVRRLRPSMSVVMITGCGQREVIDQALSLGAYACLVKPFSIRDVIGMLEVVESVGGMDECLRKAA